MVRRDLLRPDGGPQVRLQEIPWPLIADCLVAECGRPSPLPKSQCRVHGGLALWHLGLACEKKVFDRLISLSQSVLQMLLSISPGSLICTINTIVIIMARLGKPGSVIQSVSMLCMSMYGHILTDRLLSHAVHSVQFIAPDSDSLNAASSLFCMKCQSYFPCFSRMNKCA